MIGEEAALTTDVLIRPVTIDDAEALARAYRRNRAHLAPWDPGRPETFYTTEGQAARVQGQLDEMLVGRSAHWVFVDGGEIVGHAALSNIVLGPVRSGMLGYWTDAGQLGRGLASAATRHVCEIADTRLGLHRVEAGTLLDNTASQRVLVKCGFQEYGVAPKSLYVNGAWRDHRLFQRILNDRPA
ncbi:GNAT family N-acetyltransferase [Streptomyces sp. BG9H]|uniref:GNAT family N-acetyltransferase n=1 Tax=Streptomyces anatolicus TaxID=2675858 RepID=A0ABS6YMX8_9ACTN|nr:GNAT family protein [Streptomyces anatolicus]MBW5422430.1 GNAT family N-acetyltransferase [Streptomyces anatolicus]